MKLFAFICLFTVVSVHQINAKRSEVNIEDDAINMISRSGCALDADNFNPCEIDTLSVNTGRELLASSRLTVHPSL